MFRLSRSASFHTVLVLILVTCFSPFIRSEDDGDGTSFIRMPVDDVCSGVVPVQASCPVKCFRTDPVCGIDGVTYWCGCSEARCAGIRVAKTGFCDVDNGGSASLSGQAFLLVHIVWLIVIGFSVLFGLL